MCVKARSEARARVTPHNQGPARVWPGALEQALDSSARRAGAVRRAAHVLDDLLEAHALQVLLRARVRADGVGQRVAALARDEPVGVQDVEALRRLLRRQALRPGRCGDLRSYDRRRAIRLQMRGWADLRCCHDTACSCIQATHGRTSPQTALAQLKMRCAHTECHKLPHQSPGTHAVLAQAHACRCSQVVTEAACCVQRISLGMQAGTVWCGTHGDVPETVAASGSKEWEQGDRSHALRPHTDLPGRTCLTMPRASMHTTPMPALPAPSTAKRCSVIASGVLPAPTDSPSGASAGHNALAEHTLVFKAQH